MCWRMRCLVMAVMLSVVSAGAARGEVAEGCAETIDGGDITGELLGDVVTLSFEGSSAIRIERVGHYILDDGTVFRITCEAWLLVISGTQIYLVRA